MGKYSIDETACTDFCVLIWNGKQLVSKPYKTTDIEIVVQPSEISLISSLVNGASTSPSVKEVKVEALCQIKAQVISGTYGLQFQKVK